jgi:hypothetical protein
LHLVGIKSTDHPFPIRKLKKIVLSLLRRNDFAAAMDEILAMPARRVANPLFSFLYHGEAIVRWRAVTALGAVTADLADRQMESARVVFRRLMWNLNDESGGIGWGSVEVMGEILARHRKMRAEYLSILLSYLDPCGNFLEHEGLQLGALWAAGRVAGVCPGPVRPVSPLVRAHLISENAGLRGTAAWSCGCMADADAASRLADLQADRTDFVLWVDQRLERLTVGAAARQALDRIQSA